MVSAALVHAVRRMEDMRSRRLAAGACRALRAAACRPSRVAECMRAGTLAVTREIEAFVFRSERDLVGRCISQACSSVLVFGILDANLADWGEYGHRWHLVTLIVAAAVNVTRWRDALVASGREADRAEVYCAILREADARSAQRASKQCKNYPIHSA